MKEILHIYTRVSTSIQEEGTSLKTQKETGIELAKKAKHGLSHTQ
jgi:DNA invertase Pin-like site-specific DNA recombinase